MQKLSPIEISEICDELGEAYPKNIKPVHGGDIHSAWQIEFTNKKLFLKRNDRNKKFLEFEKYCLKNLRQYINCLLYTSPSPRDNPASRMPSSA